VIKKVSVHLTITVQSSGVQRIFDHRVLKYTGLSNCICLFTEY